MPTIDLGLSMFVASVLADCSGGNHGLGRKLCWAQ